MDKNVQVRGEAERLTKIEAGSLRFSLPLMLQSVLSR